VRRQYRPAGRLTPQFEDHLIRKEQLTSYEDDVGLELIRVAVVPT